MSTCSLDYVKEIETLVNFNIREESEKGKEEKVDKRVEGKKTG